MQFFHNVLYVIFLHITDIEMFQEIPTKQHHLALGIKVSIILINAFSNHYLDAPLSLKVYTFLLVAWQLCKRTKFDEFQNLLMGLNDRFQEHKN